MASLEICDLEEGNSKSTRHVDRRTPNAVVRLCLVYLRNKAVWDGLTLESGRTVAREGGLLKST